MDDAQSDQTLDEYNRKSADFVKWFTAADGSRVSNKIKLADQRNRDAGRGVVAVEDIDTDEELFAIPRSLVLTTTTSSIPPNVLEPLQDTGNWPPLIVTIIFEYLKGESSSWYPYFEILPTTFNTLMFWNPAELAELQASAVVNKIGKAKTEEAWKSSIIPVMLENPELFPVEGRNKQDKIKNLTDLAHLAGSLIMAYAFDIDKDDDNEKDNGHGAGSGSDEFEEDDEDEPLKGMVPFADLLNAEGDLNNARLFQEDDYLIMKATKPIKANDEIFNDYGPLPRSDLLRMYGYVTDNYAQYDVVEFEHSLLEQVAVKDDPKMNRAWMKRKEALDELGVIDDGYSIAYPGDGDKLEDVVPGQVHILLRGLCNMEDSNTTAPKLNPKESLTTIEAALLSAVVQKKLSEYPTSAFRDMEILNLLAAGKFTDIPPDVDKMRYRMAIEVRRGEKHLLNLLSKLCHTHMDGLRKDIVSAAKKRKQNDNETTSKKTVRTSKR